MKKNNCLLLLGVTAGLFTGSSFAAQCLPNYKGYQWDRVVMDQPSSQPNGVLCLYNGDGNPKFPPRASYSLKGNYIPNHAGSWSGTSEPGLITCIDSIQMCDFKGE